MSLVQRLPVSLCLVPHQDVAALTDLFRRRRHAVVEETIDIDHVDLCAWVHLRKQRPEENDGLAVAEPEQVVSNAQSGKPAGGRRAGKCKLDTAVPDEYDIGFGRSAPRLRLAPETQRTRVLDPAC